LNVASFDTAALPPTQDIRPVERLERFERRNPSPALAQNMQNRVNYDKFLPDFGPPEQTLNGLKQVLVSDGCRMYGLATHANQLSIE
jgi:hypothetical protein